MWEPGLEEAFRLLWKVRLEHQAAQSLAGLPPDDSVNPGSLPPLTRRGLKDAFRLIARAQRALGSEIGFAFGEPGYPRTPTQVPPSSVDRGGVRRARLRDHRARPQTGRRHIVRGGSGEARPRHPGRERVPGGRTCGAPDCNIDRHPRYPAHRPTRRPGYAEARSELHTALGGRY